MTLPDDWRAGRGVLADSGALQGHLREHRDEVERERRPFQWALGEAVHTLAPKVREHVLQPPGTEVTYRGRMRVWRDGGWRGRLSGWLLRLGVPARTMFPETGEDVGFEMRHRVESHPDGSLSMTWLRTFRFAGVHRRFDALMRFYDDGRLLVDWIGGLGLLQVELSPRAVDGTIVVTSRREWVRLGPLRIPIPGWFQGRPHVREWQAPDGTLRIRVEIHNPILGQFFGYEGSYRRVGIREAQGWSRPFSKANAAVRAPEVKLSVPRP